MVARDFLYFLIPPLLFLFSFMFRVSCEQRSFREIHCPSFVSGRSSPSSSSGGKEDGASSGSDPDQPRPPSSFWWLEGKWVGVFLFFFFFFLLVLLDRYLKSAPLVGLRLAPGVSPKNLGKVDEGRRRRRGRTRWRQRGLTTGGTRKIEKRTLNPIPLKFSSISPLLYWL